MRLMKLKPEVIRLRRIAKACAAGELSRTEYREARRQVIDQFTDDVRDGVEDTVPRFDMDVTQRRDSVSVEPVRTMERPQWPLWMLLMVLVVVALLVPVFSFAAESGAIIDPVSKRDPNPTTSPRFAVTAMEWSAPDGLDAPTALAAREFLAEQLSAVKQANAPQAHGFSEAELQEVGRFLNAVGVHDEGGRFSRRDVEDLRELIRAQKDRRGVSLTQLEQIASRLQDWIREQGYPIARAYIPAQTISDQRVRVDVQLGNLSGISVAHSRAADGNVIRNRMADLLGQPVTRNAVETRLNALNRTRGLHAQASFVPGAEVGDTEMVLHVTQQQRVTGSIGVDNFGVKALGEERLVLSGQWNNPRGVGDVLSARAFSTLGPADHQYGQLGYRTPIMQGRFDAEAQAAFADVSLGEATPLDGDGLLLDGRLTDTRLFTRTQRRELYYRVGLHDLDWDAVPGQRAWFVGAGIDGHRLWDAKRVAVSGSVEGLFGGVDDERPGQDSPFWRVRAGLNAWTPVRLPWLDTSARLILDVRWQLAADLLPATLRLGATGPYANKGFEQAAAMLDQGVGVQGALRFDAPLGEWWLFMDSTYGEQEGTRTQWQTLSSAGLGWEGQVLETSAGRLSSRVTVGYPISHKGTGGMDDEGTQVYWSLRFEH